MWISLIMVAQPYITNIFVMTSSNGNIFRVTGHLCGNSPVTDEFPTKRPVTRSFDVFFDLHLRLNKRLSKQWWGCWFETPSRPLWRHSNVRYFQRWRDFSRSVQIKEAHHGNASVRLRGGVYGAVSRVVSSRQTIYALTGCYWMYFRRCSATWELKCQIPPPPQVRINSSFLLATHHIFILEWFHINALVTVCSR